MNEVGQLLRRGAALAIALALAGTSVRLASAGTTTAPPPAAVADTYAATEDTPMNVAVLEGLLANDNPGPDSCVFAVDDSSLDGTLALSPDGSFVFTPAPNFNGTTSFTYGFVLTGPCENATPDSQAVATINVAPVNDAPTATGDSFIVLKDRTLIVGVPGVLINDHDVDGDTLTAVKVTNPSHGAVVLASDGSFSYTPATGYTGPDAFSYKASDGLLSSPTRVVSLTVTAIPPVPTPTPVPTATATPTPTPEVTIEPSPSVEASPSLEPSPSPSESVAPSVGPSPTPAASAVPVPTDGDGGGLPLPVLLVIALFALLLGFGAALYVPKWLEAQRLGRPPED